MPSFATICKLCYGLSSRPTNTRREVNSHINIKTYTKDSSFTPTNYNYIDVSTLPESTMIIKQSSMVYHASQKLFPLPIVTEPKVAITLITGVGFRPISIQTTYTTQTPPMCPTHLDGLYPDSSKDFPITYVMYEQSTGEWINEYVKPARDKQRLNDTHLSFAVAPSANISVYRKQPTNRISINDLDSCVSIDTNSSSESCVSMQPVRDLFIRY